MDIIVVFSDLKFILITKWSLHFIFALQSAYLIKKKKMSHFLALLQWQLSRFELPFLCVQVLCSFSRGTRAVVGIDIDTKSEHEKQDPFWVFLIHTMWLVLRYITDYKLVQN